MKTFDWRLLLGSPFYLIISQNPKGLAKAPGKLNFFFEFQVGKFGILEEHGVGVLLSLSPEKVV